MILPRMTTCEGSESDGTWSSEKHRAAGISQLVSKQDAGRRCERLRQKQGGTDRSEPSLARKRTEKASRRSKRV